MFSMINILYVIPDSVLVVGVQPKHGASGAFWMLPSPLFLFLISCNFCLRWSKV